jgi:hypothetical protein
MAPGASGDLPKAEADSLTLEIQTAEGQTFCRFCYVRQTLSCRPVTHKTLGRYDVPKPNDKLKLADNPW